LQTLVEIGTEKNTTVVFALPIDMISAVSKALQNASAPPSGLMP
jgi:hypothetical protein